MYQLKQKTDFFFESLTVILSSNCISFANCTTLLFCCIHSNSLTTFYLLLFWKTRASPAPSPDILHTCLPLLENPCYDIPQLLLKWGLCSHSRARGHMAVANPEAETSQGGSLVSGNRGGSCQAALQRGGDGHRERRATLRPPTTDLCSQPGIFQPGSSRLPLGLVFKILLQRANVSVVF